MQTVQSLFSGSGGGATAAASAPADPMTSGAPGSGASSSQLSGLSQTGSVVSSLAKFAMGLQQASGLDQQRRDAEMAGRQEYVSAQETANSINAKYGQIAGAQVATAAASGLDPASASITEARYVARNNADAAVTAARRTADININLRRAQALALKQQAGATRLLSGVNLVANVASAFATGGMGG